MARRILLKMNAPWALANQIEEDEDRDIRLTSANWLDKSIQVQIKVSDNYSKAAVWQIRCEEVLEHNLKCLGASTIELTDDHPLLWKFRHDNASAYFNGTPSSALAVVGGLYEAHQREVGDWFSLQEFVNAGVLTSELLRSGNGLLAQGPIPLLEIYKEVTERHGIQVEIQSPYPPSGRMSSPARQNRLRNESKVLLIGESFITGIGWTASQKAT